ncbi:MAG: fibronectin type III domain-containing protein [Vicinamibacterales bacterium]
MRAVARWDRLLAAAVVAVLLGPAVACGKKGPPLAPLPRVPAAVTELTAHRRDDVVSVGFLVPSANVGGDAPADVASVELYAVTSPGPPVLEEGEVPEGMTLVRSTPVRRPVPAPPAREGVTPPPVPREPGVADQGEHVQIEETLTPALREAVPAASGGGAGTSASGVSVPLVFSPETARKRHYAAVAVSRRGRRSAWSAVASVPVSPAPEAPRAPEIHYDASTLTLTWTAPPGGAPEPPSAEGLLEARPLAPVAAPIRFNLYPAPSSGDAPAAPAPLNPSPLAEPTFAIDGVGFGAERCFVVRSVQAVGGIDVEGPASPPACVTPMDTFPPGAPSALEAVGGAGVVSLIWDPVDAPDLAGYLVFRGAAGDEPTALLTPDPIQASSYEDRTVTPGTRYVYVVVAVDSAAPPNRSAPSNRAEGEARQ